MNRRNFLKSTATSMTLLNCFPAMLSALERSGEEGKLERRSLGKTGEKLSILGFGGIVVMNATAQQAAQRVGEAIEAGINYFDVAPTYENAEERLGPALQPYRKNVFLACKTTQRSQAGWVGVIPNPWMVCTMIGTPVSHAAQRPRTPALELWV